MTTAIMGFPPIPDQQPATPPPQPAQPGEGRPAVDTTPWQYPSQWDPIRARREQQDKSVANLKRYLKQFGTFCCFTLFFYLAVALIALVLLSPDIMSQLNTASPNSGDGVIFVITPSVVPIMNLTGEALVAFFIFLLLAIIVSFLFLLGDGVYPALGEMLTGRPGKHSSFLTVGGLFFAIVMMDIIYYQLIATGGVTPITPNFGAEPLWESTFGFARASVWEEVISRVLLIGVPLLWIDLLARRDKLLKPIRYFLGGGYKLGAVECALIVFSSLMFGLAHEQSWDIWKVTPAFIAGLSFGYIFVEIGLFAAIVFHFAFDFLDVPISYFGSSVDSAFALLSLLWLVAGAIFIIYYGLRLARFVNKGLFGRKETEQTST